MSRRLVDGKLPVPRKGAKKGGRPKGPQPHFQHDGPQLTEDQERKFLQALRIGGSVPMAGALQGIAYNVLRDWVLKGYEFPDSRYGALLRKIDQAIAEWEMKDLTVIEMHAMGRPAQYEMEVVRDEKGKIIMKPDGQPLMQIARDGEGNPIVRQKAIESDWRAAMTRMERRKPRYWGRIDHARENPDSILTFDNKKPETKEALSFDEKIAKAIEKLEEDV